MLLGNSLGPDTAWLAKVCEWIDRRKYFIDAARDGDEFQGSVRITVLAASPFIWSRWFKWRLRCMGVSK